MGNAVKEYISKIRVEKCKDIFFMGGIIIFLLVIESLLDSHVSILKGRRTGINDEVKYMESLSPEKLEFIKTHRFEGSAKAPANFDKLIKDFASKNKIKAIDYNTTNETTKNGMLSKNLYSISFLVWHDDCVFDLFSKMYKFTPGFAAIRKFNISRVGNVNTRKPFLRVELSCALYYSK
jgi:hypothetical protein